MTRWYEQYRKFIRKEASILQSPFPTGLSKQSDFSLVVLPHILWILPSQSTEADFENPFSGLNYCVTLSFIVKVTSNSFLGQFLDNFLNFFLNFAAMEWCLFIVQPERNRKWSCTPRIFLLSPVEEHIFLPETCFMDLQLPSDDSSLLRILGVCCFLFLFCSFMMIFNEPKCKQINDSSILIT